MTTQTDKTVTVPQAKQTTIFHTMPTHKGTRDVRRERGPAA